MKDIAFFEKHLDELKMQLVQGPNFKDTFKYFLDYLGDDVEFLRMGKRVKNPDLKKILQTIGDAAFNEKTMVTLLMLTSLEKQRFLHGTCLLSGRATNLIYFKEVSMGMVAIATSHFTSHVLFVRFTAFESPNKHLSLQNFTSPTLH